MQCSDSERRRPIVREHGVLMILGLAALALAAGAACGGKGSGSETGARSAIEWRAQVRAESIGLELSDFTSGWRRSPPEDQANPDELNICLGVDFSGLTRIADAESQEFAMGEVLRASSTVVIFKSAQEAGEALRELAGGMSGDAAEECVQDFLESAFAADGGPAQGLVLGDVSLFELSLGGPAVEEARAWQVTIPMEASSGAVQRVFATGQIETIYLREGSTVATVTVANAVTDFDPKLRDRLVQAVAGRMSGSRSGSLRR